MRHLCSFLRLVMIAVVVGMGSLAGAKPAEAQARYAHLTWKKTAPTTAEFTFTAAFQRNLYTGRAADGFVAVGDRFSDTTGRTILRFGDGTSLTGPGGGPLVFLAVAIDANQNFVVARAVDPVTNRDRLTHTYSSPNNPATQEPWIASLSEANDLLFLPPCCRDPNLQNNGNASLDVQTRVDLAVNNNSPVSSLPPIVPVSTGGGSFFVPALDADGDTLRYRFAAGAEAGSLAFTQPTGATIDPLTGEYTAPPGLAVGLWSSHVVIEEYNGSGNLIGQVGIDFIIRVRNPGVGNAPVFETPPTPANGEVLTAVVGRQTSYLVRATDNGQVFLNTSGIPTGASHVAALPVFGNPAVSQFTWTPTRSDIGAYSISYTASDFGGNTTTTSVNILVIDGLDLIEPDGGEFYFVDDQVSIRWTNGGRLRPNGVRIDISRDGGVNFDPTPIAASTPDDGEFTATVTGPFSLRCRVRITNLDDPLDYGQSEADFTISDGSVVNECHDSPVVPIPDNEPAFTEIPLVFSRDLIIRSLSVQVDVSHPYVGDLELELQHPDGTLVLLHDETGEGSADLDRTFGYGAGRTPPVQPLTLLNGKRSNGTWKLRIRDLNPGDVGQLNRWCLTVIGPDTGVFTVALPEGGERWAIGTTQRITWDAVGVIGDANVQISRDGGLTWTTIGTTPAANKQFDWLVTGPETAAARARVISVPDPVQLDVNDANFSIQNPFMRVLQPNGGESISTGRMYEIRWDAVPFGSFESVAIELSTNGGVSWTSIAGGVANTGSYMWTPEVAQVTAQARIRVTANSAPSRVDISDANFTIQQPALSVTAPTSADVWYTYTTRTIEWSTVGVTGNVNVEVSRNGGASWELILVDTPNDGSAEWAVTGPAASSALVRVRSIVNPLFEGSSDPFAIREMSVTVTSPNGGEVFGFGSFQDITWSSAGVPGNVDIELSTDGGSTFTPLFVDQPNGGSRGWFVPLTATTQALIRVTAHGFPASDESNAVFTIVQPQLTLVAPSGGETLRVGSSYNIRWTSVGFNDRVHVELRRSPGAAWERLFTDTANDGSEIWTVTAPDTTDAVIRVISVMPGLEGLSESNFSIVTPAITVTAPNGGEQWFTGSLRTIRWNGVAFDGDVRVELTRDGGSTWETLFAQTNNDGSQDWTVSGADAANARVRITSLSQPTVTDQSDGPFSIVGPSIKLGTPNGGQVWLVGRTQLITWNTVGLSGNLDIDLSLDNGSTWTPLFENTPDDGSQSWLVSGAASTSARIRITSRTQPSISDASDSSFTITPPDLQVTSPSGGTRWRVGELQTITWEGSALLAGGSVTIQLSRNNGRSYETIIQDTANDGSATWQVAKPLSAKCKVKVIWNPSPKVFGVSAGTFRIIKAAARRNRR